MQLVGLVATRPVQVVTGDRDGQATRAQRMAMPLARDVVKDIAIEHGGCIRPVQLRRTDLTTGETEQVLVPCGHTLASVCPACAERAKNLRAAQCREGWHLDREPDLEPDSATDNQEWWIEKRAEVQAQCDQAAAAGEDTEDLDELLAELDEEISRAGMRGNVAPDRGQRRHRSTRRRQDAPPLPRRKVDPRTVGKTYTRRTARRSARRCSSPSPVPRTGASPLRAHRPIRTAMTTPRPRGTRCTSPRCSTGSSRTSAATAAMTCSTSPPSSRSAASPRMRTWRSAAPSHAANCAR